MTEVPEHLLARSAKRRQEMTGEGGDAAPASESTPATPAETSASPAPAAAAAAPIEPAPAPEPPAEPPKPWVSAATTRQKIPVWVAPVLVFLPVWFAIYWATLEPPTREATGPLAIGGEVYAAACSSCHGGTGGGGVGPQLNGGEVLLTFPDWQSQVAWIINGSPGVNGTPYGDAGRPGGQRLSAGGMPAFVGSLEAEELLAVVLYERVTHGGESIDDIAALEAAVEGLESGAVSLEFEDGMTGEDIAEIFADLDLGLEETAAE